MHPEKDFGFNRLVTIMDELRERCPWDKKQTIQSLRQLTIEETFELADAITESDWNAIREELGDILLHIVFYAKIAREQQAFTLEEMINAICEKLISRHPHIYGDVQVADEEEVKRNWEQLKLREGKKSILSGVPRSLPATVKAMRLQEKAKQVGFEWETRAQVWQKVKEEEKELEEAVQSGDSDKISGEFGDLVFSLINYARFLNIDAEDALERTNKKFMKRFMGIEAEAAAQGKSLGGMSLEEMDALWETMKRSEQT